MMEYQYSLHLHKLTEREYKVCCLLGEGHYATDIAKVLGTTQRGIMDTFQRIAYKLDLPVENGVDRFLKLAVNWNCQLYQIGLRELKLLPEGVAQ